MLVDFIGSKSSLTHKPSYSLSNLYLNNVQMSDIGNYTCQPSGLNKVRSNDYIVKDVPLNKTMHTSAFWLVEYICMLPFYYRECKNFGY